MRVFAADATDADDVRVDDATPAEVVNGGSSVTAADSSTNGSANEVVKMFGSVAIGVAAGEVFGDFTATGTTVDDDDVVVGVVVAAAAVGVVDVASSALNDGKCA